MPLNEYRVLDLSRHVAGNQLSVLLADFGADVIKVEQTGTGDSLRRWRTKDVSTWWEIYGRNKRSIELDFGEGSDQESLRQLVKTADVLIESFKPGDLDKFGLSPSSLFAYNPKLIIIQISGWGNTGSMSAMPGFGTLVEAMSGFASMNGAPDGDPILPPGAVADMVAGTYGAFACLVALLNHSSENGGQVIDLSLFEPMFSILGPQASNYLLTGEVPARSGSRSNMTAPRNVYRCADDEWIALSASTQPMAERLFRTIGRSDLIQDNRFVDNTKRLENVVDLDRILSDYFGRFRREEVLDELGGSGVTVSAVADIEYLLGSDYFTTRKLVEYGERADGSYMVQHAPVPPMSKSPPAVRRSAPSLGEHTSEVLGELG